MIFSYLLDKNYLRGWGGESLKIFLLANRVLYLSVVSGWGDVNWLFLVVGLCYNGVCE